LPARHISSGQFPQWLGGVPSDNTIPISERTEWAIEDHSSQDALGRISENESPVGFFGVNSGEGRTQERMKLRLTVILALLALSPSLSIAWEGNMAFKILKSNAIEDRVLVVRYSCSPTCKVE
jgi:hypothetical protein